MRDRQLTRLPHAVSNHIFFLQSGIRLEERLDTVWLEVQDNDVRVFDLLKNLALAPDELTIGTRHSCVAGVF